MIPTVEANVKAPDGRVGIGLRTEYRESFVDALKKLPVQQREWMPDAGLWWIDASVRSKVEELMLRYWCELMRVGGDDDGAIVTRNGVVAVQTRLL